MIQDGDVLLLEKGSLLLVTCDQVRQMLRHEIQLDLQVHIPDTRQRLPQNFVQDMTTY